MAGRSYHFSSLSSDPSEDEEETEEYEGILVSSGQSSIVEESFCPQPSSARKETEEELPSQKTEEPSPSHTWKNENLKQKFTQLLLLEKPYLRSQESFYQHMWVRDEVKEHLIDIGDLFGPGLGPQGESQTVVLYGPAGIGKSTLARQVKEAWEEGRLYKDHFQHMVFISCRELDQPKVLSLEEVIMKDSSVHLKEIRARPKQLLFILDDVDELQSVVAEMGSYRCEHWSQPQLVHTLVSRLLRRSGLLEASLLITARTTALHNLIPPLKQPCLVEVLGFSESSRKEYFHKHFPEESQALKALSLVEWNSALWTLCLVPWVSWLVCMCLKQQMERGEQRPLTPQTTTALCLHYLCQALPAQTLGTQLRRICSLAAEGIRQSKTLFSMDDLSRCGLDSTIITTFSEINVVQKHDQPQRYSFVHSGFQAFFEAMSFILVYEEKSRDSPRHIGEIIKSIQGYRSHLLTPPTISFLCGLLSKPVVDRLETIFTFKLHPLLWWDVWGWIRTSLLQQPSSLKMFHCLYESQNELLLSRALKHSKETRMNIQTDVELLVVTFCLKFCRRVKRLQLREGGQQGEAQSSSGVVLSTRTPLTDTSWTVFFFTLQGSRNLRELNLSGNLLSYSAVQNLCEMLRHPWCHLETLRLAHCGLTSSCCQDLAFALNSCSSLKNLDLRWNDLGDRGVKLLCEGRKQPSCHLLFLCLELDPLSDLVKEKLSALEQEKCELIISSRWKPSVMSSTEDQDGREMSKHITSLKWQIQSPDDLKTEHTGKKYNCQGPAGPVAIEVIDKQSSLYRVHFPVAGSYHCSFMGLGFVVSRAVTIHIEFCSWDTFMDGTSLQHTWMVAGPLFDIRAEQGAVVAVHLPHFVALQGEHVDISQFRGAHFTEEGMVLEKPARVEPHYAVLESPSFSPVGVLLRVIPQARRFIPITSSTLLYHRRHYENVTFHLYLVPCDCTIQKAIDDTEEKFQFVRIHKPPTQNTLFLGSRYTVSGSESLEIIPQELKFCYRSPGESQLFSEIFVANMGSEIMLQMSDKKEGALLWKAKVRPEDLSRAANVIPQAPAEALAVLHFVDRHREQLVARVTSVDPVLDHLLGQRVLSEEQYEQVRAEATRPEQMRKLFGFSRSWDWTCKDQLYEALKKTHPHLIKELLERS